jgi:hypothetical protein
MHHKTLKRKKCFKKEGHLGWANWKGSTLKGQIQNEIEFFYPNHLGGVHLSLVKVIA